jgi:hypothetical protein
MNGGFRIMHPEFCMVSDFPKVLKVDDRNRPHCPDGPSHLWRDGWALYHWHGVRVTAQIIEHPEQITAAAILAEPNAEVRRVMIERVGLERFMAEAGAKVIDSDIQPMLDGDPTINELLSIDLPTDDPEVFLKAVKVIDPSTGRTYLIRVPPDMKRVRQAIAWTFDVPEKEYRLVAET